VSEADVFYEPNVVVWVQGAPHGEPYSASRDDRRRRELKGLGYRLVEIWWDRVDEGLRDLAVTLGLGDLAARIAAGIPPAPSSKTPFALVPAGQALPYVRHVPLMTLEAAAGRFLENRPVEELGWVEVEGRRLREGYFAVQVRGRSMEPLIPDGALCLFRAPVEGSREGRVVLVKLTAAEDPEGGGSYTVKRYRSEREQLEDGTWRHTRIWLTPINPDFEAIELNPDSEAAAVIAEFDSVLWAP
jgi:SOS-response transcriptional repressor LexA